jgi:hypothetical protein
MSQQRPPAVYPNYPSASWEYIIDKTGAVFQTITGRLVANGPWGVRVYRTSPNEKPQLVYFLEDGHGDLAVVQRRLVLLATDKNWQQWVIPIDGYVHDSECPDATVVNIDASQLAMMKQSIATAQGVADKAYGKAGNAEQEAAAANASVKSLTKQLATLQAQVNALLTPAQVSDLVWQKIKDINYLYRLAFLAWPRTVADADINAYVADLVALIRKAK